MQREKGIILYKYNHNEMGLNRHGRCETHIYKLIIINNFISCYFKYVSFERVRISQHSVEYRPRENVTKAPAVWVV